MTAYKEDHELKQGELVETMAGAVLLNLEGLIDASGATKTRRAIIAYRGASGIEVGTIYRNGIWHPQPLSTIDILGADGKEYELILLEILSNSKSVRIRIQRRTECG